MGTPHRGGCCVPHGAGGLVRIRPALPAAVPKVPSHDASGPRGQEDVFLAEAERFEEGIGSVDHRVWRCDACAITHIEHHKNWGSGYHDCARCKRRTLGLRSLTLLAATYEHAGKKEVTGVCESPGCGYRTSEIQAIPQLQHTPSSAGSFGGASGSGRTGGSSFEGGRLGGGGAGRSW